MYKGDKRFFYLAWLLGITLFVELMAEVLIRLNKEFVWAYHLYTPFNYAFFALYLRQYISSATVKKLIIFSIVLFFAVSYSLSGFLYDFNDFPGICITINGLLLTAISVYYIFNINQQEGLSFLKNPNIWIVIGILFFFGGTAFFNGVYTKLMNLNKARALNLFGIINKPLNISLYSCINIGLVCRAAIGKFTFRQ